MKKNVLLLFLSLMLSAEEITVTVHGSDAENADEMAQEQAVEKYQKELTDCSVIETDMDNYEVVNLEKNNIVETGSEYKADYVFDVEPINASVKRELLEECDEEIESRAESRATKQAISDFAGRFHMGLMAYGLVGYGVGGYGEYHHSDFFSISVTGSYNKIYNSAKSSDLYSSTEEWNEAGETLSAGVEIRLLLLLVGYEHVFDYAPTSDVISVKKPTGAYTLGLIVPLGKNGNSRFEGGFYYKQFNDEIIMNTESKSNSYTGGFIVRAKIF